jgi:4-phospho-D-threonate 3-dehydrogenase / 4-phospho-D-erythronate 3-dehydrogenase
LTTLPHIGITVGDPGGIGPEVVAKALADGSLQARAKFTVFGRGIQAEPRGVAWAQGHKWMAGDMSFRWVEEAIAAAKLPVDDPAHIDAVVTGPISKEAWALAGHHYPGHTELFAERFGGGRCAMMFYAPPAPGAASLNVILVTTHVPLREVAGAITRERVLTTIELGAEAMRRLGCVSPRLAVCGLNPHAGENGLLGTEDRDVIGPAVEEARGKGIDASGPFPADTIFAKALHGAGFAPSFDLVVAMYHDQGLAPVKLIARDRTVNMTVGLPVVRTSPDHGTAFDIAGKGVADAGSMRAAIELAVRLAEKR